MTTLGPITQGPDHRLLTHKDYAIEVVGSIIRDKDIDPYAELVTDELGASSLFDLAQVCFYIYFSYPLVCLVADDHFAL